MRKLFHHFTKLQAAGGILLGIPTLAALLLANLSLQIYYQNLLQLTLSLGSTHISLLHFINDGLMTIFFFLVSLEIKPELIQRELNTLDKALLPLWRPSAEWWYPHFFIC